MQVSVDTRTYKYFITFCKKKNCYKFHKQKPVLKGYIIPLILNLYRFSLRYNEKILALWFVNDEAFMVLNRVVFVQQVIRIFWVKTQYL